MLSCFVSKNLSSLINTSTFVDFKIPSKLYLSYEAELGSRVKVSGYTRLIKE